MEFGWTVQDWLEAYSSGLTPAQAFTELLQNLNPEDPVWISLASQAQIQDQLNQLPPLESGWIPADFPLYGVPFAVKDNIDVQGMETTAGCPDFAYQASQDAFAVSLLRRAGAIVVGKTNLDQFATGLVGLRSPYGYPVNPFGDSWIPGGSSSGSAVSVARGLVPFALGTDTAGSGRVPAAFNHVVGWKPTRGLVSGNGVVPACRTLDCVSVFAQTLEDAYKVGNILSVYDPEDAYARRCPSEKSAPGSTLRLAYPAQIEWWNDQQASQAWHKALETWHSMGIECFPVDFTPMDELAELLYGSPWVAERTAAVGAFVREHPQSVHPVVADIIKQGEQFKAVDLWQTEYHRAELVRTIQTFMSDYSALLVPSAPCHPLVQDVLQEPILINSRLGRYTNFVNLADCCALALPGFFRNDGLPSGITLIAPAWQEETLQQIGLQWEKQISWSLGATGRVHPWVKAPAKTSDRVDVAVVGAHLSGMPLNGQLVELGAVLKRSTQTSPHYHLYALPDSQPPKPGLLYGEQGACIDVEVWSMPVSQFGKFVAAIPPPLAIGTLHLVDGSQCQGFLCESYAVQEAQEITGFGGWKAWLSSQSQHLSQGE